MTTADLVVEPRDFPTRLRAAAGLPMHAWHSFLAWRRRRSGIRQLLELDDRLLRDAGVLRADIERLR